MDWKFQSIHWKFFSNGLESPYRSIEISFQWIGSSNPDPLKFPSNGLEGFDRSIESSFQWIGSSNRSIEISFQRGLEALIDPLEVPSNGLEPNRSIENSFQWRAASNGDQGAFRPRPRPPPAHEAGGSTRSKGNRTPRKRENHDPLGLLARGMTCNTSSACCPKHQGTATTRDPPHEQHHHRHRTLQRSHPASA